MQRLSVLVWVKQREPGLLSIADGIEKSLVPLLGGIRIIDLYTGPLFHYGIDSITVMIDAEMAGARDYLLYRYGSQRIRVQSERDTKRALSAAFRPRRADRILILRADAVLLADWKRLLESLSKLGEGKYDIVAPDGERVGYVLGNGEEVRWLLDLSPSSGVDDAWEKIAGSMGSKNKPVPISCTSYGLRTAYEYYTFQMAMLKDIQIFFGFLSTIRGGDMEEENLARVEGTGFVKDSYISSSCLIEGYVEGSILFPHVRVARGAVVENSVVMSNNYIGEGAVVQGAVLCTGGQLPKLTPNIGEQSRIGEDDRTGSNSHYPDYLFGGLTLVGENVEIPKGFRIARNCYIPNDTEKTLLKAKDRIKAGDSVFADHKSTTNS
jgi:hypothetical protein